MKYFNLAILGILFCLSSCVRIQKTESVPNEIFNAVEDEVLVPAAYLDWQKRRLASLTQPEGWLSVCGLHWIKADTSSLGSDAANDLVFHETAPKQIGTIFKHENDYLFHASKDIQVKANDTLVSQTKLQTDMSGSVTKINHGSIYWYLIEREEKVGIRVKDTLSASRMNFNGIEYFPYNPALVFESSIEKAEEGASVSFMNVLGQATDTPIGGRFKFQYNGKEYSLVGEKYGTNWFIVLADLTTGGETYGGGRFLYVDVPEGSTEVILDFNKAENPPCYFTDYATCPLPLEENKLDFEVTAGELAPIAH